MDQVTPYETPAQKKENKRVFLIGGVIVLVLVLLIGGFLFFKNKNSQIPTAQVTYTENGFSPLMLNILPSQSGNTVIQFSNTSPNNVTIKQEASSSNVFNVGTVKAGQSKTVSITASNAGTYVIVNESNPTQTATIEVAKLQ